MHAHLQEMVQFHTRVLKMAPVSRTAGGQAGSTNGPPAPTPGCAWDVTTQPVADVDGRACAAGTGTTRQFDAVVVCNGHYSEPNMPQVSGMDLFPGAMKVDCLVSFLHQAIAAGLCFVENCWQNSGPHCAPTPSTAPAVV